MKILIIQTGKIGDMILTTPMFDHIKRKYPDSVLHVLASKRNYTTIKSSKYINKLFIYHKNIFNLIYLLFKLNNERYDFLIDPKDHYSNESAIFAKFINSKIKIGYNSKKNYFHIPIPDQNANIKKHIIERNLQILKYISIEYSGLTKPVLFNNESFNSEFYRTIIYKDKKNVLINISAGDKERYWNTDNWKIIINYLISKRYNIVISFVSKDKNIAENIIKNEIHNVKEFKSSDLIELISLISLVDLVITPDTSVVHIAGAFNIPIVALYPMMEWNYIKFAPVSDVFRVIRSKSENDFSGINSDEVIEKIKEIENII